jgi:ATP-dependent RNA helicase DHR2
MINRHHPTNDEMDNNKSVPTKRRAHEVDSSAPTKKKTIATRSWVEDPTLLKARKALPIWAYRDRIRGFFQETGDADGKVQNGGHGSLVIVGETGSGKSTQVPQFLAGESWCRQRYVKVAEGGETTRDAGQGQPKMVSVPVGGMIAVTQPRRVAATTLASRVSQEAGCPLGNQPRGLVGYSVRFDHNVPQGAKIKYLTEGMLLQEMLRDPNLRAYSAVIVDEIHERSIDVDLISGFLKQIRAGDLSGRGGIPLRIAVMSATLEVERICDFFSQGTGAEASKPEVLHIRGRQYHVRIQHSPSPVPDIQSFLIKAVFQLNKEEALPGDILAFLTGQEQIEAAQRFIERQAARLPSNIPKVKVFPLFGQLSLEAQHVAFQPVQEPFTRKVILATNIAETSVTVPGVRYVVDSGKAKIKRFRPSLGLESLLARAISKSSAVQRAGRAGREGPGKCVRLYTERGFSAFKDSVPEILRSDVLGAVLTMKAYGIVDISAFPLMDRPDDNSIRAALEGLLMLRAIADDGSITALGKRLTRFPVSAPFAATLVAAAEPEFDCVVEAIDVISCLTSGDDIFLRLYSEEDKEDVEEYRKELRRREGDLLTYLATMQQYAAEHVDRVEWCKKRKVNHRNMRMAVNIRKQLRQLCVREKLLSEMPPPDPQPYEPMSPERAEGLLKCFIRGFVRRAALLHPDGSYVTTGKNKNPVIIHPSSVLYGKKKQAILFLEHVFTKKSYAKKVSAVQARWLVEEVERE